VPTGSYVVIAAADGYQKAVSAPFTVAKGDNTAATLALTPLPAPVVGTVTGTVTDSSGKPLAGALVELSPAGVPGGGTGGLTIVWPPFPVRVAKTDQNGQYMFDNVSPGSYTVSASADGYQRATSAPFTVSQGSNTAPTLALTAMPAPVVGSVTGTVTDSSGKPLAGVLVELTPATLVKGGSSATGLIPVLFPPPGPFQIAKTDANGHYTFDNVPVGSYIVTAWAPGYQTASSDPFTVSQGSNTAPMLALMPGNSLPPPIPLV